MPAVRRARFVPTTIFLLLASVSLSGCASAIIGVGTAAVAASTTEKGFSTSVADTQILAKSPTFTTFDCKFDLIIMQAGQNFWIGKITHIHNAW